MGFKEFQGAPFGVQTARFDVSGVHPKSKNPGTFTEVSYDRNWTDVKTCRRGPGMYHPDRKGFDRWAVERRAAGPGWARQQEVETIALMPHLLNRELYEQRQALKGKVGPGSYNFKDSLQLLSEKPGSTLGICDQRADRFGKTKYSITPGPGTYGKNGIPASAMEEKNRKSTSTKGMLDTGSGSRLQYAPVSGSSLAPCTYSFVDSIDKFLSKVVSLRGPYDLFTADRSKPISTGHFAEPKYNKLGPGHYEMKSSLDEWKQSHKKFKGRFGKVAQYPRPPPERNYNTVVAQCPKEQYFPGPGAHSPSCPGDWPKVRNYKQPAFLSTAERVDRRALKNFTGNFNPVGVGRYDITKFENAQHRNCHENIFLSKGVWSAYPTQKYIKERIRGKNVPVAERNITLPCHGLPAEETPQHMYSFRQQISA
ncbi:ciliary microtubule-associated protein 2-like [Babylonia areolata]|uniref:ciliary microtubule-associated protein 2-like n=1 Tax=Babylonia areolata TaxID=304850 RepID=UPI003FD1A829